MKKILFLLLVMIPLYAFSPINSIQYDSGYIEKMRIETVKKTYISDIIRTFSHQESGGDYYAVGGSGDKGKYQILQATWDSWSHLYFGEIIEMSPENQELMIKKVITDWVEQGLTIEEIAAKWNSGSHKGWKHKIGVNRFGVPYNVPEYVHTFVLHFNKIKRTV